MTEEKGYAELKEQLEGLAKDMKTLVTLLNMGNSGISGSAESMFTRSELARYPFLRYCVLRTKANGIVELRYRRDGQEKSFSSMKRAEAKRKCMEWAESYGKGGEPEKPKKRQNFGEFALKYMETVKKPNVTELTYEKYFNKYKNHIERNFADYSLSTITPIMLQEYLLKLREIAPRTCEDVLLLLRNIFDYAVENRYLERNPAKAVKIPKHERTTGQALTKEAEREFLKKIRGHRYELAYLIMLYTGCRPCEYRSMRINEDNTLTFKNGKLKQYQKEKERVLPLFPKLAPYIERIKAEPWEFNTSKLADKFSTIVPGHTLKDLRHTFTTRARECGIENEIVSIWTAHSLQGMTAKVYTHFTLAYMQEQAERLIYEV